jgi:hypothetical protein
VDIHAMSQLAGASGPVSGVQSAGAGQPLAPDDLVVEDFQRALQGAPQAAEAQPVLASPAAGGAQGPRTLGDAILSGIDRVSAEAKQTWEAAHAVPAGPNIGLHDLLTLQANFVKFSFLYEVIGKGISKSVQNLDSLVKMQ